MDASSSHRLTDSVAVPPLSECLVVDLSSSIAGAYCTRLLSDGGADVIKVESPAGDPLRRWSASGAEIDGDDGALFQYLAGGKRSVVVNPESADDAELLQQLLAAADTIVWSPVNAIADDPAFGPTALRERAPDATVVSITPVGLSGPWAERTHTEFTLQAWSGGAGVRGTPDRPPVTIGGRTGEWTAGMFGAIGALVSRLARSRVGTGELVDVSMLESIVITHSFYPVTSSRLLWRTERNLNFPSIEPTKDGMVGFTVGTPEQWAAFCTMIEREDWLDDPELADFTARYARFAELRPIAASWLTRYTTAEVIEIAEKLRLPVAEIGNGETLPRFAQAKACRWFTPNPRSTFLQPSVPYQLGSGAGTRPAAPAPRLGEDTDAVRASPPAPGPRTTVSGSAARLPLEGLRVADFTTNWAGPFLTHQLAMFGADVIRVESVQRLDGVRLAGPRTGDQWWETCGFSALNTNKRAITLDMSDQRGQDLTRELCAQSDVVVDNYSPHVMERWGLDYGTLSARKPDLIQVRMPGFGLSGPWRDRVAWAMTAEQLSGLAWLTGYPDQMPQVPSGLCDPVGGGHGLIGLLLALEHRRRTGEGMCVEIPLMAGAVTISSEQVIEFSAYGNLLERDGNRSPLAAPQNLYRTADLLPDGRQDRWVAIAVETDEQWHSLRAAIGRPGWCEDPSLDTHEGRRAMHDTIDEHLGWWCQSLAAQEIVERLAGAGVPVGTLVFAHEVIDNPQLVARGWWATLPHPVGGHEYHNGYPVQFSSGPTTIHRRHAPLLGEHNRDVLVGLLGISEAEYEQLEADGVIGTRPGGTTKSNP